MRLACFNGTANVAMTRSVERRRRLCTALWVPREARNDVERQLEIGLKENARYRQDNLPTGEVSGPELNAYAQVHDNSVRDATQRVGSKMDGFREPHRRPPWHCS